MAIFTRGGRWAVEEHTVSVDLLLECVACRTCHFFVAAFQWKFCLVMIKKRRAPLVAVVASGAIVPVIAELSGMWVFVAFYAGLRRIRKFHMHQRQLHIRRLVAIGAGHCAMRAEEWKARLSMVEF